MADKPDKPTGEFELKTDVYALNGNRDALTDNEYLQGRNNTGEVETPLGSIPNALKENWMFEYITTHLIYIEQMLDYLVEKVDG